MTGCHISTDWIYKGIRTLILENKYLRIVSLLDKGSDIIEILYKPLNVDFMWHSPLNPKHQSSSTGPCCASQGSFLDRYEGGWQDILPNAGPACTWRGVEWGQHSETALLPWNCTVEKSTKEEVIAHLRVECHCYPLSLDKWLILGKRDRFLTIKEELTNKSEQDLEFSWLQHLTFGPPFLAPSNVIDLSAKTVETHETEIPGSRLPVGRRFKWPIIEDRNGREIDLSCIPGREEKFHDLVYLMDLERGWYSLTNKDIHLGFGLVWDEGLYPYVWFWQPLGAQDYPWFGRAWAIGLEPCTSWPSTGLADQISKGTASKIRGGSTIKTEMKVVFYTGLERVSEISSDGEVMGPKLGK